MKHPVQRLRRNVYQIEQLLDQGAIFSLTAEERQSLRREAKTLSGKLTSIESTFLIIGLLGGTGVGKSSLMNALAGSQIASTSHRRPHTDRVLIYRYVEANPLPVLTLADVPWQEITHHGHAIQHVLICDLPDFDSLLGKHREHVVRFLEHLDVLVWVTSPEKYADGRFYEFLRVVPKSEQNFYFVLNKLDLLFQNSSLETGYEQMGLLTQSFHQHIKENGISEPMVYGISAKEALSTDQLLPWNQFPTFRQQILQQRDIKQITAIKVANLDVEIQQLLFTLERELLSLQNFEQILHDFGKELEGERPQWVQAARETIDLWLEKQIKRDTLSYQGNPSRLVGPGYGLALLLQDFQMRFRDDRPKSLDISRFTPPQELTSTFERQLQWVEDRIGHRVLRTNLPSSFVDWLHEGLHVGKISNDLKAQFSHVVALRVADPSLPSFWGFKALQYLTYFLLLAFFLLVMGGEAAWRGVLDAPGGESILRLSLSIIQTLFSARGLAALASYALLNLFFAFRFYRRYRRLLHRAAKKILDRMSAELLERWEEKLDFMLDRLNALKEDIRSQISAIPVLAKEEEGGGQTREES